jgi:regulator of protease activity HflC (stomatin/prohibitin superfamily)
MSRHDSLIIKDTHRGLLYEDGLFREVLPAGRFQIPRPPSRIARFFGAKAPKVEVVLVDIRGRDRTIVVQDLLTADGATISSSFVVQFRVEDPIAAIHEVKSFEDRLYAEAQTAARRILRGMSVEEVLIARDEIGEELLRQVRETASTYGLEVTGVDFKDLIVPEKLKEIMNQAILARRRRHAQPVDADSEGDDFTAAFDPNDDDDSDLIIANARFDRAHNKGVGNDPNGEARPEKLSIRPHSIETRNHGIYANNLDFAFRRRLS